ncbi:MAG: FAD-binding oxidoreductase [Bacteroidales bacterium]|nr:FAD-binding oxidoreductase [Bacteroidales bacterium]
MNNIDELKKILTCEVYTDIAKRTLYATDASAYKEMPQAVVFPENKQDIKKLILFANEKKLSLIPRGGGTSLAGQVVGNGIVVDISKNLTNILEINKEEKWVRVEPGIILTELNRQIESENLFFGPETSSGNRVTIGGMVGNNASGLHLLVYGDTRSKLISVNAILSDGSEVVFEAISKESFKQKLQQTDLEGIIYNKFYNLLKSEANQKLILDNAPSLKVKKRNTGYALENLIHTEIFGNFDQKFNIAKLIAGSEGTLAFITEVKIQLDPTPPKNKALVCVHFNNLHDSFKANLIALKHNPAAVELMDKTILNLTKDNIEQRKNRFFIKGEPEALLFVEFSNEDKSIIEQQAKDMEAEMQQYGFGYHFAVVWGAETKKVWNLRKAGLGVLSNLPGDARPVSLVEDTAVDVEVLPEYLVEFDQIMQKHKLSCVYHAHIGSGELHLRPILNLKDSKDVELFHTVALEVAHLVKKYRGSLSGEHGDGRLRGEFIPLLFGKEVYGFFKEIKQVFDPNNIFNPGKIVDTPPMNSSLRYNPDLKAPEIDTLYDFSDVGGYMRAIEKCNGSGDCRKSEFAGGTMCPSFQATRNEWNSTRARANTLREFITNSKKSNVFNHQEIYKVLDTCLSCKACKSECPSNVDITKLKAEFLEHYYKSHRIPLRTKLIANFPKMNKLMSIMPKFSNFMMNSAFGKIFAKKIGFSEKRSIPNVKKSLSRQHNSTLISSLKNGEKEDVFSASLNKSSNSLLKKEVQEGVFSASLNKSLNSPLKKGVQGDVRVYLFNDEFTNFNDSDIGLKAIMLLEKLGYKVVIPKHVESGRTYLSKGLVKNAKKIINKNTLLLKDLITDKTPLIGIEPSAILTFRDESIDLALPELKADAQKIAKNAFMFDEFIAKEIDAKRITAEQFTTESKKIKLHGHCYQKALASTESTKKMLSLPINYEVKEIKSGCCGMAGSFGYEKEHYNLSMAVGELILFPEIRKTTEEVEIAAPGTSCRHQIKDGTNRNAKHPVEILYEAVL